MHLINKPYHKCFRYKRQIDYKMNVSLHSNAVPSRFKKLLDPQRTSLHFVWNSYISPTCWACRQQYILLCSRFGKNKHLKDILWASGFGIWLRHIEVEIWEGNCSDVEWPQTSVMCHKNLFALMCLCTKLQNRSKMKYLTRITVHTWPVDFCIPIIMEL